jgi:ABC-type antimicrobial peptide transport system permease subunit
MISASIRIGFAALRSNLLRTTLSALGVIIGVGAMVSVLSLSDGVEKSVRAQLSKDGRLQSIRISTINEDVIDGQRIPRTTIESFSKDDGAALTSTLGGKADVKMVASSADRFFGIVIAAKRLEDLPAIQKTTESWLAQHYPDDWKKHAKIMSYAEESARMRDNMVLFKILMAAITGVSLVVGGVGIMNVLLASVTERTREIGVRKATGARNKDLLAQFLSESVAIAGMGSVLGTLLGIAVATLVASIMRAKTEAHVYAGFSFSTLMVAVSAPVIVGIAFGIYPALRAARLSPIEAIRHE